MLKTKDKLNILKATRGKKRYITYRRTVTGRRADLSSETTQTKRQDNDIFNMLQKQSIRSSVSGENIFQIEGKVIASLILLNSLV